MVGAVVIVAYIINIGPVSEKRDNVKGKVKQSVCEPLETVYHGAMSNISSSKDKPEDIEDSKETEKKDLKPKSTEKPKKPYFSCYKSYTYLAYFMQCSVTSGCCKSRNSITSSITITTLKSSNSCSTFSIATPVSPFMASQTCLLLKPLTSIISL